MKKQTISRIAQWCAIVSALAAAAVQTAAMLTSYATDKNYFTAEAVLPSVAVALALLSGVCGILAALLSAKERCLPSPIIDSVLPGIPAACGLAYGAFLLLTSGTASSWAIPTAILMLAAALYSLLLTAKNAQRFPTALTVLGFLAVAACAMINVYCYFDTSLEMNAPIKVMIQTALLFTMVYYTAQIRFLLGREMPRLYLALSYCAVAALSLPAVSIYVSHVNEITSRADYFAFGVATLGLLASILLRLLCYTGVIAQEPSAQSNDEALVTPEDVSEVTDEPEEASDRESGEENGEKNDEDNDEEKENEEE